MSSSKQRQGYDARRNGQVFEEMVRHRATRIDATLIKIPDGCRRVQGPKGLRLLPVTTPFDFVLMHRGYCITMDAKTTDNATFTYSQLDRQQLQSLYVCDQNALRSGYLIWFRKPDLVSFLDIKILKGVKPKTSVDAHDGIVLGKGSGFDLSILFQMKEITAHLKQDQFAPIT